VIAEFLVNMSASADVLAMAKVEVDMNNIPEGKNVSFLREASMGPFGGQPNWIAGGG
jgi:hypothetical protein